jgi:probable F420-dependent oxidoreductase
VTEKRWGITVPLAGKSFSEQRDWIVELADLGYTDLWSAEVDSVDAFSPLLLASQWAPSLRLGTAIVPVYTRGPALIAQSAAAAGTAAPGNFVLGIGASSNVIVERWNAMPFEQPYKRVRDTLRFVRAALTGEKIKEDYETFSINGFRLTTPPPKPVPILVAALRSGMLRLAGREADGAIINWLSPQDVKTVVPYVGPDKEVVARIFVLLTDDADTARGIGRSMIAAYLNVPVYAAFHEWLGRGDVLGPMWSAWKSGDRKKALEVIPDSVVDELIVHGSADHCREVIEEYVANGVTTPAPAIVPFGDPQGAYRALAPR